MTNPRNNLRLQQTFLTVDFQTSDGNWKTVATDSNWETKFHWKSTNKPFASRSEVTIEWDIPGDAVEGTYRICYYGDWKQAFTGKITHFTSCSSNFQITAALV